VAEQWPHKREGKSQWVHAAHSKWKQVSREGEAASNSAWRDVGSAIHSAAETRPEKNRQEIDELSEIDKVSARR